MKSKPLTVPLNNWSYRGYFEVSAARRVSQNCLAGRQLIVMTINSEHFQEICNSVWRDRALVLKGRGFLSGEAALMRAVYWRLSKTGIKAILSSENYGSPRTASSYQLGVSCLLEVHARPRFNGAQFLKELIQRYKNELRKSC